MNIRIIGNYLGKILALDSVCMIPSLLIALFSGESPSVFAFAISIMVQVVISVALMLVKSKDRTMYAKEGFVIVALSWVLIAFFGAMPMCISGAIPSYLDAVFETISGFTTTGSTILSDIEILPKSVLFWRSFTHWLGGMGVLVLLLALTTSHGVKGMPLHIMRAESPGPTVGKLAPKINLTARILYLMYIALTLIELVLLLFGKMPFFDAITTTFGCAGTGGFSIKNDSMASYSTYCQGVASVFMMLFGINFSMYFLVLIGDFKSVFKNSELRTYISIIIAATGAITIALMRGGYYDGFFQTVHHAFFQVSSIITTTGFSTVDFQQWPEFTHVILLMLMVVGACAGSTGGGIKVSRLVIMCKSAKAELKKLTHPRSVSVVKVDGSPLEESTISRCYVFFFIYALVIALSVLLLSIEGNGFKTNFSAVLACLNNIGPGMDAVGPVCNFGFFTPFSKVVLMIDMLLGRLELFPLIITFMPSTWSKRDF